MMPGTLCNCCGLSISGIPANGNCPRCGYPVDPRKEEQFLFASIRDLQRVAAHGGAAITVAGLLQRYQSRLQFLVQREQVLVQSIASLGPQQPKAQPSAIAERVSIPVTPEKAVSPPVESAFPIAAAPSAIESTPGVQESVPAGGRQPVRMFSWRAFLEEQIITIIAILAAFLILIGALSFIITTSNLFLSFSVVFVGHAIFGVTGVVTYRFRSFRTIAIIYTAIFTLLVPLVGFSGYGLVAGHLIELSVPTLIAIAAGYAALVYGALAVYQKFSPFAYLALIALIVADLATAMAYKLGYWWWPSVIMALALCSVVSLMGGTDPRWPFKGSLAILRTPVRALMSICVAIAGGATFFVWAYSLIEDITQLPIIEVRFALVCVLLLGLCWLCLTIWRTRRMQWGELVPYLLLPTVLALCYALAFGHVGYAVALTLVAMLFYGINRLFPQVVCSFGRLSLHLQSLTLVLMGVVPFIATPLLPLQILLRGWGGTQIHSFLPLGERSELVTDLGVLVIGLALTLASMFDHAGWRKVPQKGWSWLLLLAGFQLSWIYSLITLVATGEPGWWFFVLTVCLLGGSIAVRRWVSAAWAAPFDVLVLCAAALTLLLGLGLGSGLQLTVLLIFAGLAYLTALYQQRKAWLFLPLVFAGLALPLLMIYPYQRVLFVAGLFLPLAAAFVYRERSQLWKVTRATTLWQQRLQVDVSWEWPLLICALAFSALLVINDLTFQSSTVADWLAFTLPGTQHKLAIPFPASLELTAFALVWYSSAAWARMKWWLVIPVGCAVIALTTQIDASNGFWVLAWLAPLLVVGALAISRFAGRDWAIPFYASAIYAAIMAGSAGMLQGNLAATAWVLLTFALVIYAAGVIEYAALITWVAPCFAIWSVYLAGVSGDLYRPFVIALLCAGLGVGARSLRFTPLLVSRISWQKRLLSSALPLYATALAAALLSGLYGTLGNVNTPFYAAIPAALLTYALLAFGILLVERWRAWHWLVAAFALWGIGLMPRVTDCLFPVALTSSTTCGGPIQTAFFLLVGIALFTGGLALVTGYLSKRAMKGLDAPSRFNRLEARFYASWPWYLSSFAAMALAQGWNASVGALLPKGITFAVFAVLIVFSLLMVLVERVPELLTASALLACWIIGGDAYGAFSSMNMPFYAAIPLLSLAYALLVYAILRLLRWSSLYWLGACFVLLAIFLMTQTTACVFFVVAPGAYVSCSAQVQMTFYLLASMALLTGVLALWSGRFGRQTVGVVSGLRMLEARLSMNWPWYLCFIIAVVAMQIWSATVQAVTTNSGILLSNSLVLTVFGALIVLSLVMMLVERVPELLTVPVWLALWTIWQTPLNLQNHLLGTSALCVLVFGAQFLWRVITPAVRLVPIRQLYGGVGISGQFVVVLLALLARASYRETSPHLGAILLGVLAALVFWYGLLETGQTVRRWCQYATGMLIALVATWELWAFGQTRADILWVPLATYLLAVAPFIAQDEHVAYHFRIGQLCSIVGAALLLLPTLWLSFQQDNLHPALLLTGESAALFFLGIATRVLFWTRWGANWLSDAGSSFLVYSGAAMIVVSAIHLLFLTAPGLSIGLLLALSGLILLVAATGLALIRRQILVRHQS